MIEAIKRHTDTELKKKYYKEKKAIISSELALI
jgi:hypothetical protein